MFAQDFMWITYSYLLKVIFKKWNNNIVKIGEQLFLNRKQVNTKQV